ncbi:MAG: hypothetical protein DYH13_06730 [Alphaproteobacteria bacterium PRO2]|nr:hypothetical protein [Alphaproteobacteria bacterium PRO2]
MLDAKVDIEGTTPAKFWKEAKLGYDHTIFEKPKQPVDSLRNNKSFLDAAALVYKMKNGETWLEHCERENIDPKSKAAQAQLGEFGITTMRWFNNTTASAADLIGSGDSSTATLYQLQKKSTTNEQRAAFLYMMQAFEHTEGSFLSMGTLYGLGQGMTDATNLIGVGIGAFTGGAGTVAVQAARAAMQATLKTLLVQSVKTMSMKSLAAAGVEGAVASGTQNYVEQKVQMQKFKVDGKAYQYQHDLDTSQIGEKSLYGFGFGAGLGATGKVLRDTGSWLKGKWTGNITPGTPTVAPVGGRIIPPYEPNFVYRFVDALPGKYPFTQLQGIFNNTPMFSIKSARYIRPVIKAIDDNIMASDAHGKGLGSVLGIGTKLKDIAADLEMGKITLSDAQARIQKTASDLTSSLPNAAAKFNAAHSQLTAEARALTPNVRSIIQRQIDALNQYIDTVGNDVAKAVADIASKKPALDKNLTHLKKLIDDAQQQAATLSKKDAETLLLQTQQDLAKRLRAASNPFKDSATLLYEESQMRLTGKLSSHRPLSKEGSLKGKAFFETQRRLERSLQEGYFMPETYLNPANRIIPITMPNPAPGKPHNMERTWLELENFYVPLKGQKYDARTLGANMAGKIWEAYMMGQEHELLYALRYLGYSQGENRGARFALDGGIPEIIPSTVIRQELDNSYKSALQNLPGTLASKTDKDWQNFRKLLDQVMIDANQGHSPAPTGQRRMEQLFQTYSAYFRIAQRYRATNNYISPTRFSMDFVIPMNNNLARARAFWLGGQTIPDPSRPDYITPVYNLWWKENKPENGGLYNRSPFWIKSPVRMMTGGIASAPGLITYGTLGAAGLIYDFSNGNDISWEKRKDYTAYQLLQFGLIPGKTVWGAAKGWGETWWNTKKFLNAGGVTGAAQGFKEGVKDAQETVLGDIGNPLSYIPTFSVFGTKADDDKDKDKGKNLKSARDSDDSKITTPKPVIVREKEVKKDGSADPKLAEQAKIEKETEEARAIAREDLRIFGRTVASLTNSIADDGKWTESRQETVKNLEKQRIALEAQVKNLGLGNYANDILKQATETLDFQLRNNMTHGWPTRVPTFQEEENRRQHEYGDKVRIWHDRVRALNVEVQKGWDANKKTLPAQLQAEHDAFASDIAFLRPDLQETDKRGLEMLKTLAGAAKADNPALSHVRRTDIPPENPEAEQKRLDDIRKAEEAEKLKKEKEEAAKQEKARKELLAKQKDAGKDGHKDDGKKPGADRIKPKASEPARTPDGSEKSLGDHVGDWWNSYKGYTSTDESGSGVNSLGDAFGSAVSSGFNWLGNAYSHIRNKPGGGGRTMIRDVGAGIGAVIAASTLISPFWDKMWVGQIPIVGSILKLGSLVLTFMLFRKWLDTGMDPAPKLEPATGVVQAGSGERTPEQRNYLPRFADGQPVYSQSHSGGTPSKSTVVYWDTNDENAAQAIAIDMKAGKPVVQIRTDNGQTYISKGIVSEDTVTQSAAKIKGNINVPYDRLNANGGMARDLEFETVSHVGGDSFITKVGDKNHLFALDQGKTFADLALEPR